jgi:hypothetical protein
MTKKLKHPSLSLSLLYTHIDYLLEPDVESGIILNLCFLKNW